ncbi:Variant-specific surface protein [Giardia duodenalis]|uniref:Variant-specific surface protein n=2 Tax=Giardia intestinalis TaxID=5741 RepID=V6TNR3_GIAIN|nr:Variant-specific surface protein [Giardia intestinalis]
METRGIVKEAKTCEEVTDSSNPTTGQCKKGKCISIGEDRVCTDCGKAGEVPINGKCVAYNNDLVTTAGCTKNNGDPVDASSTTCGKCTKTGYFLHKGGCYAQATAPGSTICKTAGSTAGICEACQAGYFKNPANLETSDSCIACSDATGVTVGSATYKGVANCAACTTPEKGTSSGDKLATCTACVDGKYGNTCATDCNSSCKSCTGAGPTTCTSCKPDTNPYFKKGDGETGECVANEAACKDSNTHFLVADTKTCYPCGSVTDGGVADCQTCTSSESGGAAKAVTVTCSACTTPTKKPNADGTKCVDCAAAGCAKCSDEGVCAACDSSHYLTPTSQCVDSCDKLGGYYKDNNNICQPCSPECASCTAAGADKCLSCPAGKALKYTSETKVDQGGSCVDECRANTGGCETCGAVIGGSKYCSKCSTTTEVSVNGVCTADNTRAAACTTKDGKGGCSVCASGYFLLDGGCYQTSRQPGSQVCTTADSNGQCSQCANTLSPNDGVCPACPAGCSKCSGSSTCTECLAGYYLDSANACKKCSETSGDIQGVENCISCLAPTSPSTPTPVTCYVTQTPTVDPADPSVNKTGLSSGAIAGISVAVIAVVGGLVGFLCWWFVCRGKA